MLRGDGLRRYHSFVIWVDMEELDDPTRAEYERDAVG